MAASATAASPAIWARWPSAKVATITIVVDVPADVAAATYTNTAYVGSPASEINTANNQSEASTGVSTQANLSILKSASPNPAIPGQDLLYVLTVLNAGPSDAQGVVVTDTLPADFTGPTLYSSQGGCTALPCSLGALAAGESATVSIQGTVAADASASLTNLAGVSSSTTDPITSNNSTSLTTPLSPQADLVLAKADLADPVEAGTVLTYVLTVTNRGPATAANVRVTDTLPSGLTFNAAASSATCTVPNADTVVCVAATNPLPAGDSLAFTVVVTVAADTAPGVTLINRAVVGSSTPDPAPDNNSAFESTQTIAHAHMLMSKSSSPATPTAGQQLTYTIVVTNTGPADATNVHVLDSIPPGLTLISATPSDARGVCFSGVMCLLGTLSAGESFTVTVVTELDQGIHEGTWITNTAAATADQIEPAALISATHSTQVAEIADLGIAKNASPDPVAAGGVLRYTLRVTNTGPSNADNIVVSDTLDSRLTFQSASFGCQHVGGVVTCTVSSLAAGELQDFDIFAVVSLGTPDGATLVNTAVVTTTSPEISDANNTAVVSTTVRAGADLAISKSGQTVAKAGGTLTYTLQATNNGPSGATGVVVTDTLPSALVTSTATIAVTAPSGGSCVQTGAQIVCTLGGLSAGASGLITISAQISSSAVLGSVISNMAKVGSATTELDASNNSSIHETLVVGESDLGIVKTGPATATAGESRVTYTLTFSNSGPSSAANVLLDDILPAGTDFGQRADDHWRLFNRRGLLDRRPGGWRCADGDHCGGRQRRCGRRNRAHQHSEYRRGRFGPESR